MAAFINTYSTVEGSYLATNMFTKEYIKRDIIVTYLLQPNFL
jgi:hypothetical protein